MPEWITPLLWPVWWAAQRSSFSTTTMRAAGWRRPRAIAVDRPTMPPPRTATSYAIRGRPSRAYGRSVAPERVEAALGQLGPADEEVGQPRVGPVVAQGRPVDAAHVQAGRRRHRRRGGRVPLVHAAGVGVD